MDNEPDGHILKRWFSIGDAISAVITLVGLGIVWGSLSKDVQQLRIEMNDVKTVARGMTPGAAEALAAIRVKDTQHDQDISELRTELRDSRRELLNEMRGMRDDLNKHMERN